DRPIRLSNLDVAEGVIDAGVIRYVAPVGLGPKAVTVVYNGRSDLSGFFPPALSEGHPIAAHRIHGDDHFMMVFVIGVAVIRPERGTAFYSQDPPDNRPVLAAHQRVQNLLSLIAPHDVGEPLDAGAGSVCREYRYLVGQLARWEVVSLTANDPVRAELAAGDILPDVHCALESC